MAEMEVGMERDRDRDSVRDGDSERQRVDGEGGESEGVGGLSERWRKTKMDRGEKGRQSQRWKGVEARR